MTLWEVAWCGDRLINFKLSIEKMLLAILEKK